MELLINLIASRPSLVLQATVVAGFVLLIPYVSVPLIVMFALLAMIRRRAIPNVLPECQESPKQRMTSHETDYFNSSDGLRLMYRRIPSRKPSNSTPTIVFACPLGSCGFRMFYAIMAMYGDRFHYVTWDYRGVFGSEAPKNMRRTSIAHHAEDLRELVQHLQLERVKCVVGHSMGVQVALEFAALYPEHIDSMVLINGTHGQIFQTAFQPVFRVPFVGDFSRWFVTFSMKKPYILHMFRFFCQPGLHFYSRIYTHLFGSRLLTSTLGDNYLGEFGHQYFSLIAGNERNTVQCLYSFLELDAHSIYHMLPNIGTRTLVVSGFWDTLTPAYCGFEMARKMPNATLYIDWFSSHATLLENPESLLLKLNEFFFCNVKSE